jgi:pimeloyl-ACP methyl ester carboxylesterase
MATSHSNEVSLKDDEFAMQSGKLNIRGHDLYWERYGDPAAPIVMLLHHGLGSIRSWRRQIPAFVRSGWQVLVYDRWGYGRSDTRTKFEHAYLAADTQDAFELIDALGVTKLALVGHSDGGSIALLMAAQQPQRIEALVVVAAHIYFEPMMSDGLDLIAESTQNRRLIAGLQREHGARTEGLVRAWVDHWRSESSQSLSMRAELGHITCPTLVIQGKLDEHATPQHARDIAEGIEQSQLWLIADVKHMPPHEIPNEFNQRVLTFLTDAMA